MSDESLVDCISDTPSQIASCLECGWTSTGNQHAGGARKAAYLHTYQSGHQTECSVIKTFEYKEAS